MGMTDIERRALKGSGDLSVPDMTKLPARVPRDVAAQLVTKYFFEVSPRTLERAPLLWRRLNNKAHVDVPELFDWATSIVSGAALTRGGRRASAVHHVAA
jgi:hypothetical protein